MASNESQWKESVLRRGAGALLLGFAALAGAQQPGANVAEPAAEAGQASLLEQSFNFDVPAQKVSTAILDIARQANVQALMSGNVLDEYRTEGLQGRLSLGAALDRVLAGTQYAYRQTGSNAIMVGLPDALAAVPEDPKALAVPAEESAGTAADPEAMRSATASVEAGRKGGIEEIIVTAQKREERIQDIPIAISAFSSEDLNAQKIEGGFDLLKAIPNVTFSKNNFTSYNFSIRGVGTKAVSATTDPGVAVSFNNTSLIQNRLFEQEYFDIERVEVLRGPQGTLYGRNATAGVVNVISAKAKLDRFEGNVKAEVGNFDSQRLGAMVNIPIVADVLGMRVAGSMTDRDGFDYNSITGNAINGRDLWSGRTTFTFQPSEKLRADLIWEHFEEDDNRSRTGKQLCHRDDGPTRIGNSDLGGDPALGRDILRRALFSQGCKPGSLYSDDAFSTPNGLALPFVFAVTALESNFNLGATSANGRPVTLIERKDPYGGMMQSRDMRTVASKVDPVYRAEADIVELNVEMDVSDELKVVSQTAYNEDSVFSIQDFNRFNTVPIFIDTAQISDDFRYKNLAPNGVFCDPQIGCSDTMVGLDMSTASGRQFSQEFRLQSSFGGDLNFSAGINYTRFKALVDYYVFYNLITAYAQTPPFNYASLAGEHDPAVCRNGAGWRNLGSINPQPEPVSIDDPNAACPFIDQSSLSNLAGDGHNYFRSKNPYELESAAAFGELYWGFRDNAKLTLGLRYTDDQKTFTPVPSQVLLSVQRFAGGTVSRGYPELDDIEQRWREWTGRIGVDWKPDLSFTKETMLYASYSRGYKGGGANPPLPGFATAEQTAQMALEAGWTQQQVDAAVTNGVFPYLKITGREYEDTFKPEFINAFEIGAKNTLFDGAMMLNTTAFFYDYADYQVSQIRDRTAVNENFDAAIWGAELELLFVPTESFQLNANLGFMKTRIGAGESSIDIMDRTQGNPDYVVMKPWVQLPSNCVAPVAVVETWVNSVNSVQNYFNVCGGWNFLPIKPLDPTLGGRYDVANYPEINGGAGIRADLTGNELPNAPRLTGNLGAQYGMDIGAWRTTLRGDFYWQDDSYARVYNTRPYDQLKSWYNVNLGLRIERDADGLVFEVYAKNLLNDTPITDAFLNSDDTALTTNVFTLDPRLIGLSIRKEF